MRISFALLMALMLVAPVAADSGTVQIGGMTWYTSLDAALRIARQEHRPLWVHFGENPG
ncbi:MAG: hypothetical protein ACYCW6_15090 [Candidatus Xenobia bacterium]